MSESITPPMRTPRMASVGRFSRWGLLRVALVVDAVVTGANGAAYLLATDWLAGLFGYPAGTLRGVGTFLLVYAVIIAAISRVRLVPAVAAWSAILTNIGWTAASLASAAATSAATMIGRVWTVMQALVVLAFAVAQLAGWRRIAGTRA